LTGNRFLLLPENQSAHAAICHLADRVGSGWCARASNSLYLHGPAGCGKSSLVSVLVAEVTRRWSTLSVQVLDSGDLALCRSPSSADDDRDSLRAVRSVDVLAIEDVQHLDLRSRNGQSGPADALAALIDYRVARSLATIVTGNVGPGQLHGLPTRTASRLAAGLVVAIPPLGTSSRLRFLEAKAQRRQLAVHPDVLGWLAERLTGSGRQLNGAIAKLDTLARLNPRLDLASVAEYFGEQVKAGRPTVERITRRVGAFFRVEPKQLQSRQRYATIMLPRQLSMYLARQLTELSLGQIGQYFGGRDHTTVLHACRKVERALTTDALLSGTLRQLEADLS
jgi:chromosomal replication initiator protein